MWKYVLLCLLVTGFAGGCKKNGSAVVMRPTAESLYDAVRKCVFCVLAALAVSGCKRKEGAAVQSATIEGLAEAVQEMIIQDQESFNEPTAVLYAIFFKVGDGVPRALITWPLRMDRSGCLWADYYHKDGRWQVGPTKYGVDEDGSIIQDRSNYVEAHLDDFYILTEEGQEPKFVSIYTWERYVGLDHQAEPVMAVCRETFHITIDAEGCLKKVLIPELSVTDVREEDYTGIQLKSPNDKLEPVLYQAFKLKPRPAVEVAGRKLLLGELFEAARDMLIQEQKGVNLPVEMRAVFFEANRDGVPRALVALPAHEHNFFERRFVDYYYRGGQWRRGPGKRETDTSGNVADCAPPGNHIVAHQSGLSILEEDGEEPKLIGLRMRPRFVEDGKGGSREVLGQEVFQIAIDADGYLTTIPIPELSVDMDEEDQYTWITRKSPSARLGWVHVRTFDDSMRDN